MAAKPLSRNTPIKYTKSKMGPRGEDALGRSASMLCIIISVNSSYYREGFPSVPRVPHN